MTELTNIRTGKKEVVSNEVAKEVMGDKYLKKKYRSKVVAVAPKLDKPKKQATKNQS